jgi:hypothetical protein
MARPGLEPGTPRFSVVRPSGLNTGDLQGMPRRLAWFPVSVFSRTLRSFPPGYGRRRGPSAFRRAGLLRAACRRRSSVGGETSAIGEAGRAGARECSEQVAERAVAPGGGLAVEDREQRVGLLVKREQFSRAGR